MLRMITPLNNRRCNRRKAAAVALCVSATIVAQPPHLPCVFLPPSWSIGLREACVDWVVEALSVERCAGLWNLCAATSSLGATGDVVVVGFGVNQRHCCLPCVFCCFFTAFPQRFRILTDFSLPSG